MSFTSFEFSSVTLALPSSKLTVFNIYRPHDSSNSQPFSAFLDQFQTFLSSALTIPHDFLFTGDFNIPVNNPVDPNTKHFLNLLSSLNLTQHISVPTHLYMHVPHNTLDLLITSSDSKLSPAISQYFGFPSYHIPTFSSLDITPSPRSPPSSRSFRRINSINIEHFKPDIASSVLFTNPPPISSLALTFDSTLRSILNKHAPLVTKFLPSRPPNYWFNPILNSTKSYRRFLEKECHKPQSPLESNLCHKLLQSVTNRYHRMVIAAKKLYFSDLVQSNSSNPRRLWQTVNSLLHRNQSHPLPSSSPNSSPSLAQTFANFFSDKITKLHFSLKSNPTPTSPHSVAPPPVSSLLSSFSPALCLKSLDYSINPLINSATLTPSLLPSSKIVPLFLSQPSPR
jgi:hypothetical protein